MSKLDYLNQILVENMSVRSVVLYTFYHLSEIDKKRLSLPLEEMVIKCSFGTQVCTASDFDWFYDYDYGNCFSINSINKKFSNLKVFFLRKICCKHFQE